MLSRFVSYRFLRQRYVSYNIFSTLSRTFFNLLYLVSRPSNKLKFSGINHNGERGIWTLAPRERPTPLAGAPLQPLEYFSKFQSEWHPLPIFYCASSLTRVLLYKNLLALSMHFTLFLNIYVFTIQSSSVSSGALTVVDYTRSYQNSPESLKQWIFVSNYCQISQKYLLYVLYALHQFLPKRDIGYMPNFLPKFFGYFTMFLQKEIIIKR